ncbi:hypothetical protein [Paenibacillus sp. IHBB 10380]|uniref:hypothetical protein n=1 Tax=Paenibacillus sp. IHBB 10380 TaxID=1566358 RepID=UPI0005CF9DC1|nr:hypothetical protein [Paenibacillus sp. IHBB 10380]AJS57181.1 hypothetical protein UB51_00185 [Paenibacillus sp. IHBB 10380]
MEKNPDRTYLSQEGTGALSNTEMLEVELATENEADVPSIWENSTEILSHLMADWSGRQETHHMFLQSYD